MTDAQRWVSAAMVPYRWAIQGTSLQELDYENFVVCFLVVKDLTSLIQSETFCLTCN